MHCPTEDLVAPSAVNIPSVRLSAERLALAADLLRGSGRLRLQVHGESMLPILWPRDVVEIAGCSLEDARPGEIVLPLREGRFFLHRFVARRPNGFLLQGDSMPAPDPQFPEEAMLGRLVGREDCAGQKYADQRYADQRRAAQGRTRRELAHSGPIFPLRPWSWALGRLLCCCGPARRLALKMHAFRQQRRNIRAENVSPDAAIRLGV